MYTVYVLISARSGIRYVGQTANLTKRVADHNGGNSRYTKNRGPWQVSHTEEYATRSEAMRREKFLKSGRGRDFLNNLVK